MASTEPRGNLLIVKLLFADDGSVFIETVKALSGGRLLDAEASLRRGDRKMELLEAKQHGAVARMWGIKVLDVITLQGTLSDGSREAFSFTFPHDATPAYDVQ